MPGPADRTIDVLLDTRTGKQIAGPLEKVREYANVPFNTKEGQDLKLAKLKAFTKPELTELVSFFNDQPVWVRASLQNEIGNLELANAVKKTDLLNILRDVNFAPVPPGLIGENDKPDVAMAKALSWAYVHARDAKTRERLFAQLDALIGKMPVATSDVLANVPIDFKGPFAAYLETFNQAQALGDESGERKKRARSAMADYARHRANPTEAAKVAKERGTAMQAAELRAQQGKQAGSDVQQTLESRKKITLQEFSRLTPTVPKMGTPIRRGDEYDKAQQIQRIALERHSIKLPDPPPRLTNAQLKAYATEASQTVQNDTRDKKKEVPRSLAREAPGGIALKHALGDMTSNLEYMQQAVDPAVLKKVQAMPMPDVLKIFDRPMKTPERAQ